MKSKAQTDQASKENNDAWSCYLPFHGLSTRTTKLELVPVLWFHEKPSTELQHQSLNIASKLYSQLKSDNSVKSGMKMSCKKRNLNI
jgi:hypothetical protein